MAAVAIRGTTYPVVLPKLRDPRLHLAATITSLQVLGQVAFHFRLSIPQILLSLATCAVIEVGIAARRQHVLMWPASALLTGNGVAFVLRVPGTHHGDWWSLRGWWIFVGTAAVSLLSKHVLKWQGAHVFNPSNIGLVLCFLLLGRTRAEPLDFWWGPMSWWMALALAIIVTGGFAILRRLGLLRVALVFWATFAVGMGGLALAGHELAARWHLGPLHGFDLWWVLVTSPEVLVFLFFMITDPKTAPAGGRARVVYAACLGPLAALLIAPTRSEFAAKVALLSALAVVCAVKPFLAYVPRRRLVLAAVAATLAYPLALVVVGNGPSRAAAAPPAPAIVPPITILASRGVQTQLDRTTAKRIAHALLAFAPARPGQRVRIHLEAGAGQDPPFAVATLAGRTYRLSQDVRGRWGLAASTSPPKRLARVRPLTRFSFNDVAQQVGLDFTNGVFRYGVTNDPAAMMGGGLCWLDFNHDGWLDLFVVNSYGEGDIGAYEAHGGLPRTALFRNDHGRFTDVTAETGAGRAVRGEGCVAADFNGDGYTDLFVSTAQDDELLWNDGHGHFSEGARSHGVVSFGWHAAAAVADVNGDGRPDLYVAGYTEANGAIPSSTAGFPTNHLGVRDELFLNLGNGPDGRARFREVGSAAGLDPAPYDHSLGALFTDVNRDARPDLYVANDEDPNRLYLNEPGGRVGFHFVERAKQYDVADANAGMGVALGGRRLVVTNSRDQLHADYRRMGATFVRAHDGLGKAGTAGWGVSFIDLANSGRLGLAIANGAIPIADLSKDADRVQVFSPGNPLVDIGTNQSLRLDGRGVAVADYDNDGREDIAVNSIGGPLVLFRNTTSGGHWLEVSLARFAPGAVVTVALPDGSTQSAEEHAGSSYLSSEDPRLHFGLGAATHVDVLTVRWPDGRVTKRRGVRADRIVSVR
jgi:Na+-translocating ferredoxin:NAD+ oxidoreductase RnfD subunit